MIIRQLVVGQLQTNCYIAACDKTKKGVVIDPGDEAGRILGEVESLDLDIQYILNTHAHFDHIGANEALMKRLNAPIALHPLDLPILKESGGAAAFGLEAPQSPDPTIDLKKGQMIEVGTLKFQVLFTPGHTPGHVSFYERGSNVVFDGDVLFDGGIGRTDIPGGSTDAIIRSIKEVLFKLPAETVVYSGHGNPTTIGQEQSTNPWIGLD